MRLVIQRVKQAQVEVSGEVTGAISTGLLVFVGVAPNDSKATCDKVISKLIKLRVFDKTNNNNDLEDSSKGMSYSVLDVDGEILVVSQFTLLADLRKGTRPSFTPAAHPSIAEPLYDYFISKTKSLFKGKVATGIFGADMQVSLINDGPVTLVWDVD